MNLDSVDPGAIGDIISSLSNEDIENLKNMAESLFVEEEKKQKQKSDGTFPFDLSSITKIASLMSLFSSPQKDPRCELLTALKPLITEDKRPKVDQAIKMLQIMAVLPKLKELNILNLF